MQAKGADMGGWVFSKKQRRAGESCTAHPFPEMLPHLRTGRLMHSTDMDISRGADSRVHHGGLA